MLYEYRDRHQDHSPKVIRGFPEGSVACRWNNPVDFGNIKLDQFGGKKGRRKTISREPDSIKHENDPGPHLSNIRTPSSDHLSQPKFSRGLTYISGLEIPLTLSAQSRYALQATRIDSVPPEVVEPAPVGLEYMFKHMDTISASIFRMAGKTSGLELIGMPASRAMRRGCVNIEG